MFVDDCAVDNVFYCSVIKSRFDCELSGFHEFPPSQPRSGVGRFYRVHSSACSVAFVFLFLLKWNTFGNRNPNGFLFDAILIYTVNIFYSKVLLLLFSLMLLLLQFNKNIILRFNKV